MVRSYLSGLNRKDITVKITITGPITLGFTCAFDRSPNSTPGSITILRYFRFIWNLNAIIKLEDSGFYLLQI